MGEAAKVIATNERTENHHGVDLPMVDSDVFTDDVRGWCAQQTRSLVDRFEAGELRGYRFEFTDQMGINGLVDMPYAVQVEVFPKLRDQDGVAQWVARLTKFTFHTSTPRKTAEKDQ